jgi:hypothetical protein
MFEVLSGIWQDVKARLAAASPQLKPYLAIALVAAAGVMGWQEFVPEDGMFAAAAVMTMQDLFKATAGVFMVFGTLKFFDYHIQDDSFGQTFATASPEWKMVYFTGRFVGVCLLYGMVLSG